MRHSVLGMGAAGLAAWFALAPSVARADSVDVKLALPILLRVLTYDKSFASRPDGEFVVLVVSGSDQSDAREKVVSQARGLDFSRIQNRSLRFVAQDFKGGADLQGAISAQHASALLLTPGLSDPALADISRAAATAHVYTLALEPEAVERKWALLAIESRDGRPQIVVNVDAAKRIGAAFDSAVLAKARLIQ